MNGLYGAQRLWNRQEKLVHGALLEAPVIWVLQHPSIAISERANQLKVHVGGGSCSLLVSRMDCDLVGVTVSGVVWRKWDDANLESIVMWWMSCSEWLRARFNNPLFWLAPSRHQYGWRNHWSRNARRLPIPMLLLWKTTTNQARFVVVCTLKDGLHVRLKHNHKHKRKKKERALVLVLASSRFTSGLCWWLCLWLCLRRTCKPAFIDNEHNARVKGCFQAVCLPIPYRAYQPILPKREEWSKPQRWPTLSWKPRGSRWDCWSRWPLCRSRLGSARRILRLRKKWDDCTCSGSQRGWSGAPPGEWCNVRTGRALYHSIDGIVIIIIVTAVASHRRHRHCYFHGLFIVIIVSIVITLVWSLSSSS